MLGAQFYGNYFDDSIIDPSLSLEYTSSQHGHDLSYQFRDPQLSRTESLPAEYTYFPAVKSFTASHPTCSSTSTSPSGSSMSRLTVQPQKAPSTLLLVISQSTKSERIAAIACPYRFHGLRRILRGTAVVVPPASETRASQLQYCTARDEGAPT